MGRKGLYHAYLAVFVCIVFALCIWGHRVPLCVCMCEWNIHACSKLVYILYVAVASGCGMCVTCRHSAQSTWWWHFVLEFWNCLWTSEQGGWSWVLAMSSSMNGTHWVFQGMYALNFSPLAVSLLFFLSPYISRQVCMWVTGVCVYTSIHVCRSVLVNEVVSYHIISYHYVYL